MTRREFAWNAGALGAGIITPVPLGAQTVIDQNTVRRRGTGLRALDPARSSPGLTLFASASGGGTVYLVDLRGKIVHTWRLPYPPGYGYVTERGTLFYNGKIPGESFIAKAPFGDGVVLEADWNGRILWEVRNANHHHDGRLLKNGNVLLMCAAELPMEVAAKVKGGMPGTEATAGSGPTISWKRRKRGGRFGNGARGIISIQTSTPSLSSRTAARSGRMGIRLPNWRMEIC